MHGSEYGYICNAGANRGIGLELARQLSVERKERVIALCQRSSPALNELPLDVLEGMMCPTAMLALYYNKKLEPVDVLINNAAFYFEKICLPYSGTKMRTQFEINTLGPLR